MTLPEFRKLCRKCEGLLQKGLDRPERVAFPVLHPLGPHPSQLEKYLDEGAGGQAWPGKFLLASASRMIASVLSGKSCSALCAQSGIRKVEHLIVSHEVGSAGRHKDFYFGQLPRFLVAQAGNVLILKLNHIGRNRWQSPEAPHKLTDKIFSILLPSWGTFSMEMALAIKVFQEIRRLRIELRTGGLVVRQISRALEKPSSKLGAAQNLRFYFLMVELIRTLQPSTVFCTWEGHAWERLLIRAAREAGNGTTCIGYQHTVLFPHAAGPLRNLGELHDPDEIWTVGVANHRRLVRAWKGAGVRVRVYGSPRHRQDLGLKSRLKNNLCLVAPEGILGEAGHLFEFGKRVAETLPQVTFHFRSHPHLPFATAARQTPGLRSLPPNIKIRDQGHPDDLRRAKWFLYRGTSLVFEALECGARPLYVHRPREISIDPLVELKTWKKTVTKPEAARRQILEDLERGQAGALLELATARRWGKKFFMKENTKTPKSLSLKKGRSK